MPRVIVKRRHGYEQTTPSSVWTIKHNLSLNIPPVVDVWINEAGMIINSDAHQVQEVDVNTVKVDFNGQSVTGYALVT